MKVNNVFDRDIEYLYNSSKELGGTIYRIACESGLFEAVDYIKVRIDPSIDGHPLTMDNIEIVEDDGSYRLWTEGCYFLGDGNNVGYLCHNYYSTELVKPDIFVVEQAMNTYYAECAIRRDIDPYFKIEDIDFDDDNVFKNISQLIAQTLPANWIAEFLHGTMPVSYKILAFQIAYIKYYYPNVFDDVWNSCPPYLEEEAARGLSYNARLGITVSENGSEAIFIMPDNKSRSVYNIYATSKGVSQRNIFSGSGSLMNIGLACTNIGLSFRDIFASYRYCWSTYFSSVKTCVLENLPDITEVRANHESIQNDKERMAYEYLELEDMDWGEALDLVADMAEIRSMRFINNPLIPIMKYFEANPKTKLAAGESAIVLYMDGTNAMSGIVTESNGSYVGEHTKFDRTIIEKFNGQLIDEMYKAVRPKLDALNISVSEEDMEDFKAQLPYVKKQFIRNKKAKVVFNNGWIDYAVDMPISVMEEHYVELICSCEMLLQDIVISQDDEDELNYWLPNIKKLYLAGEMTDNKLLWELLEKEKAFGGKKEIFISGEPGNVVAKGLALL